MGLVLKRRRGEVSASSVSCWKMFEWDERMVMWYPPRISRLLAASDDCSR